MRKLIVVSAAALTLFVGQAVASELVNSVAPQFGNADYTSSDRSGSEADGQDQLVGIPLLALLAAAGAVAAVATVVATTDQGASG